MSRTKEGDLQFRLYLKKKLVREFKNEKMMNVFIKEFGLKDYQVEVGKNVRGSRLH